MEKGFLNLKKAEESLIKVDDFLTKICNYEDRQIQRTFKGIKFNEVIYVYSAVVPISDCSFELKIQEAFSNTIYNPDYIGKVYNDKPNFKCNICVLEDKKVNSLNISICDANDIESLKSFCTMQDFIDFMINNYLYYSRYIVQIKFENIIMSVNINL